MNAKLILLLGLLCMAQSKAQDPTMRGKLPALRALIAAGPDLEHGKITGSANTQKEAVFMMGAVSGAYSSFLIWNAAHPGSFDIPKEIDFYDVFKRMDYLAKTKPELLNQSIPDFVVLTLWMFYSNKDFPGTKAASYTTPIHVSDGSEYLIEGTRGVSDEEARQAIDEGKHFDFITNIRKVK